MKENFKTYFEERKKDTAFICIALAYIAFCLFSLVYFTVNFQGRSLLMSAVFILFVPLLIFAEYILKIRFGLLFTFLILSLSAGGILGSSFNFYTTIPFFDTILHGMSGVIFAALGFTIAEKFFGEVSDNRSFFGCLIFAFCFSLSIAVLWEIIEYTSTAIFDLDMMEDAYVYRINSYLLSGSHTETVTIEGITKTVIYYGDGLTYTLDGYLDIGLIDTLTDMIICTVGTLAFSLTAFISYKKNPKIIKSLIPQPAK